MATTMKAVVIKGPYKVAVEDRPIPKIEDEGDVVVKVSTSALCGSDMHIYRGHQPLKSWDFVMGHELTGTVVDIGPSVASFSRGDRVVSPFTTHCGACFHCLRNLTSRCEHGRLLGSPLLPGGQAEYVRIPLAESTLVKAPQDIPDENLILLADILPTGLYCAKTAWNMLSEAEKAHPTTAVVIGCGPVGLCAITAAAEMFTKVIAVDSIPDRLESAKLHGATEVVKLVLPPRPTTDAVAEATKATGAGAAVVGEAGEKAKVDGSTAPEPPTGAEAVVSRIAELTGGRLADAALELVGHPSAISLATDVVRIGGVVSVQGLHTGKVVFEGLTLYNKNLRLQFGRCPAGAMLPEALELLRRTTRDKPEMWKGFVKKRARLAEAEEMYQRFERQDVGKVVFVGP